MEYYAEMKIRCQNDRGNLEPGSARWETCCQYFYYVLFMISLSSSMAMHLLIKLSSKYTINDNFSLQQICDFLLMVVWSFFSLILQTNDHEQFLTFHATNHHVLLHHGIHMRTSASLLNSQMNKVSIDFFFAMKLSKFYFNQP